MKLKEAIRKLLGLSNPKRPVVIQSESVELRGHVPECSENHFYRAYAEGSHDGIHIDRVMSLDEFNSVSAEQLGEIFRREFRRQIQEYGRMRTEAAREHERERRVAELREEARRRAVRAGAMSFVEYRAEVMGEDPVIHTCFICGRGCINNADAINDAELLEKYTGRKTGVLCCSCFRVAKVIIDGVTKKDE